MDRLKEMLQSFATRGPERLAIYKDDDEDDETSYWVGSRQLYHGMRSEVRLAAGMRKDVAELVLGALLKERDGGCGSNH
ncbi:hypothetical protein [Gemmata sp.]|uniref:hypothetical protein n=1 Tax=Gemmata sp. TaxID=1914242 RepID=UPI003F7057E2